MIQPATVTTHYPSHKLQQNIYHGLTAFLCIFKNLMICKKILHSVPSHKRNQISFMSAIFIMILANEFGSWLSKLLLMFALPSSPSSSSSLSSSMQRSSYFFSLENNLKVECAIMVWLLVNHVLPKHFVYDYLFPYMNRAPFNFIYYVPHDWRKGLGLCSFIERYRKRCLHYFDAEYVDDYYYSTIETMSTVRFRCKTWHSSHRTVYYFLCWPARYHPVLAPLHSLCSNRFCCQVATTKKMTAKQQQSNGGGIPLRHHPRAFTAC